MDRYTDKMPLRILYYIREKGEISLFDLIEKIFGSVESVGPSKKSKFSFMLFRLQVDKYIAIYKKLSESTDMPLSQGEDVKHEDVNEAITASIRELRGYCTMPSANTESAKSIFISVAEKFNEVQNALGFSVTYEIHKMQEDAQRCSIFGNINLSQRSKVFVIMPFKGYFKPIYEDHIKKVCDKLEYSCKRADLIDSPNVIINDIWSLINNAEIIVCDCTEQKANVFYELGLAHALGKKVICITQSEKDIPFDIERIRYIKYEYTPRGMKEFEETLERFLITDDI